MESHQRLFRPIHPTSGNRSFIGNQWAIQAPDQAIAIAFHAYHELRSSMGTGSASRLAGCIRAWAHRIGVNHSGYTVADDDESDDEFIG
eukprot:9962583-Karenia_brevis.AAC.1